MAGLPPIRRITKEDLRDAPDWVNFLLYPLNSFMESVYSALDANLTLGDNIAGCGSCTLSFKTRSDYSTALVKKDGWELQTLSNPIRYKPTNVVIGNIIEKEGFSVITEPVNVFWDYLNGSIRVKYITGLQDSTKYEISLLIF